MEMLDIIGLNDDDTLYVLGDVLDRGPHPIKTILKLMTMPNAICMMGNHEVMAMECLSFLMQEITDDSVDNIEDTIVSNLLTWQYNGCKTTTDEFHKLNISKRIEVLNKRELERPVEAEREATSEDIVFREEICAD